MECVECEKTSEASERTNIHANMCTRMVAQEEKSNRIYGLSLSMAPWGGGVGHWRPQVRGLYSTLWDEHNFLAIFSASRRSSYRSDEQQPEMDRCRQSVTLKLMDCENLNVQIYMCTYMYVCIFLYLRTRTYIHIWCLEQSQKQTTSQQAS